MKYALVFVIGTSLFAPAHASKMKSARVYATPAGTTCDTVKQYAVQFGSIQNARAYAAANGILITPAQTRQIHACLRK